MLMQSSPVPGTTNKKKSYQYGVVRSPSECHIRTLQFDVILFSDIASSLTQNVYDTRVREILVLLPDFTRIEFQVRDRHHIIGAVA